MLVVRLFFGNWEWDIENSTGELVASWETGESAGKAGALAESEGTELGGEAAEVVQAEVAPLSDFDLFAPVA